MYFKKKNILRTFLYLLIKILVLQDIIILMLNMKAHYKALWHVTLYCNYILLSEKPGTTETSTNQ